MCIVRHHPSINKSSAGYIIDHVDTELHFMLLPSLCSRRRRRQKTQLIGCCRRWVMFWLYFRTTTMGLFFHVPNDVAFSFVRLKRHASLHQKGKEE